MSTTTTLVLQLQGIAARLPTLRDLTLQAHCALDDVPLPSALSGAERVSGSGVSRPTERIALDGRRGFKRRRIEEAARALDEAQVQLDVARGLLASVVDA